MQLQFCDLSRNGQLLPLLFMLLRVQASPTPPPPPPRIPLTNVASALKGVEFIAQHIKKADKDTEVSEARTEQARQEISVALKLA
jgi:hypothetical protein